MQNGKALGLGFWKKAAEVVALAQAGKGIIVMPTGTGKTTQAPQALHEAGFTTDGMIYVSVPKRILAVELAARVAAEMNVNLGDLVGFQIRGEKKTSLNTRILFMTEGVLRGKIRSNPTLEGINMVLFDEFHQRTLMSDFNVALVERAQTEGSKCGFLLMSATIDPSYLARHFECGVVDGSDLVTTYPITERYAGEVDDAKLPEAVSQQVLGLIVNEGKAGNGLVFADGKAMIDQVVEALKKHNLPGVTILPLHGNLDGEDRHAPFVERPGVTITVSTDIVETGATLPGIAWVIDTGVAKEVGYDPISDISSLRSRPIAQDRLWQRRGRCGRVQAGIYVGMFSESDALARPERTQAEIFRVPLREVVLTIKALGLTRTARPLRLIDSPPKANWKQAKRQLQLLGLVAQTEAAEITPLGEQAVELGCDPREAAMLLKAAELGCLREMATAIAAIQGKRLLNLPKGNAEWEASRAHARFKTSHTCDAWTAVEVSRAAQNRGEQSLGTWCRENFVSYRALQDLWLVQKQLLSSLRSLGLTPGNEQGTESQLALAIVAGLPDRSFVWKGRREWYAHEDDYTNEVCLGRESAIRPSYDPIVAWEIIEIQTARGPMRLVTNATAIKSS